MKWFFKKKKPDESLQDAIKEREAAYNDKDFKTYKIEAGLIENSSIKLPKILVYNASYKNNKDKQSLLSFRTNSLQSAHVWIWKTFNVLYAIFHDAFSEWDENLQNDIERCWNTLIYSDCKATNGTDHDDHHEVLVNPKSEDYFAFNDEDNLLDNVHLNKIPPNQIMEVDGTKYYLVPSFLENAESGAFDSLLSFIKNYHSRALNGTVEYNKRLMMLQEVYKRNLQLLQIFDLPTFDWVKQLVPLYGRNEGKESTYEYLVIRFLKYVNYRLYRNLRLHECGINVEKEYYTSAQCSEHFDTLKQRILIKSHSDKMRGQTVMLKKNGEDVPEGVQYSCEICNFYIWIKYLQQFLVEIFYGDSHLRLFNAQGTGLYNLLGDLNAFEQGLFNKLENRTEIKSSKSTVPGDGGYDFKDIAHRLSELVLNYSKNHNIYDDLYHVYTLFNQDNFVLLTEINNPNVRKGINKFDYYVWLAACLCNAMRVKLDMFKAVYILGPVADLSWLQSLLVQIGDITLKGSPQTGSYQELDNAKKRDLRLTLQSLQMDCTVGINRKIATEFSNLNKNLSDDN